MGATFFFKLSSPSISSVNGKPVFFQNPASLREQFLYRLDLSWKDIFKELDITSDDEEERVLIITDPSLAGKPVRIKLVW